VKAAVYDKPGGPEVFRYEEVPDPEPKADSVLIRVEAITQALRTSWATRPPGPCSP
jgi:NADPH:quinone reductase-like Zn-dependent oxidoreductase